MTWVKLDDNFPDHPKLTDTGHFMPLAGWLHVCALCYCGRYLTDGFISKKAALNLADFQHIGIETGGVPGMCSSGHDVDVQELIEWLVAVGLWHEHDKGWTYEIHDYLEYNPSRVQVLAERESAKARMREVRANSRRTSPNPVPVPEPLPQPLKNKDKPLSFDGVSDSVLGYWLDKIGREPKASDARSLKTLCRHFSDGTVTLAIGQAVMQGEAADNFALITSIAKSES